MLRGREDTNSSESGSGCEITKSRDVPLSSAHSSVDHVVGIDTEGRNLMYLTPPAYRA